MELSAHRPQASLKPGGYESAEGQISEHYAPQRPLTMILRSQSLCG